MGVATGPNQILIGPGELNTAPDQQFLNDIAAYGFNALRPPNNVLAYKFAGNNLGLSTGANTYYYKFSVACPFDACRITILNLDSVNPYTGATAIVAGTETAATDTASHMFDPTFNGIAVQTVNSNADWGGWRSVTWGGATSSPTLPPGAQSVAGTVGSVIATAAQSDWIPVKAIPRTDGSPGYLFMARVWGAQSATNRTAFQSAAGLAGVRIPTAAARNRILQVANKSTDDVTTPANNPTTLGTLLGGNILFELRCMQRVINVIAIGDSTYQNSGLVADTITSLIWRGATGAEVETGIPFGFINAGCNSLSMITYLAQGKALAGLTNLDIAMFEGFSPNAYQGTDSYTTAGGVRASVMRQASGIEDFLAYCRVNSIQPFVTTGIPDSSALTTAAQDNERKILNTRILALESNGNSIAVDSNAVVGNGATPEGFLPAYSFGDGVHYNEAGIDAVATQTLTPAFVTAVGNIG